MFLCVSASGNKGSTREWIYSSNGMLLINKNKHIADKCKNVENLETCQARETGGGGEYIQYESIDVKFKNRQKLIHAHRNRKS